jgi:hypothetical protein
MLPRDSLLDPKPARAVCPRWRFGIKRCDFIPALRAERLPLNVIRRLAAQLMGK